MQLHGFLSEKMSHKKESFLSPQAKRCAIISYKQGIYELPKELPNDLRLGNLKIVGN